MEGTEALAYLGISDLSEVDSRRQEILFEAKQFFVKQPVIRQVFERKMSRLKLQNDAFSVLNGPINQPKALYVVEFAKKRTLVDQFNEYQLVKAFFNRLIYSSGDILELLNVVEMLLSTFDEFLEMWDWPIESELNVVIGKEPDVMDILGALKELNTKGIQTIKDLLDKKGECPPILRNELIRLNLLKKRNKNGRNLR